MAATLLIPTGLTFSDIREGLPAQSVPTLNAFLSAVGKDPVVVGDDNPLVLRLNDFDMGGASFLRGNTMSDLASCGPIENISHLPMYYIELIVGVGGNIKGLPVYFEVDDLTAEVPVTFPNREFTTEPENELDPPVTTIRTWENWYDGMPGHDPVEIEGKYYCSNANTWDRGSPLDANLWVGQGLTVKSVGEFVALRDAE